jgi:hypothetical protein
MERGDSCWECISGLSPCREGEKAERVRPGEPRPTHKFGSSGTPRSSRLAGTDSPHLSRQMHSPVRSVRILAGLPAGLEVNRSA